MNKISCCFHCFKLFRGLRLPSFLWTAILGFVILIPLDSGAQPGSRMRGGMGFEPPKDERTLVAMPEGVQQVLRSDMLSHLTTIDQLLTHLADKELKEAAVLAEEKLGRGAMGKHRGTGMGPGRFMPADMHDIAFSMHQAADNFAELARKGEQLEAYKALQEITSHCVACHMSFRIR